MGKFSGTLLVSDLDGTLLTDERTVSPTTMAALCDFVHEGGAFSVATGRALNAFLTVRANLPITHPVILGGGSLLYDCAAAAVLDETPVPDGLAAAQAIAKAFPDLGIECHRSDGIWCYRPSDYNRRHLAYVGVSGGFADRWDEIPQPWLKLVFVEVRERLQPVLDWLQANGFLERYGAEFSSEMLLEFHAAGATKGKRVAQLEREFGFAHVYCAGDNENDLSMLTQFTGFVPGNADAAMRKHSVAALPGNNEEFIAGVIDWIERHQIQSSGQPSGNSGLTR